MTVLATPKPISDKKRVDKLYSLEEYLRREERNVYKSEFFNGQIIRRAGEKIKHNLIAGNISTTLRYTIKIAS